jgi:hypothetical protein
MFDPDSGELLHGIGSYGCRRVSDRTLLAECKNPYPCEFDRGIVTTMARKFEAQARVDHAPGGCRNDGADVCSYCVRW